MRITWVLPPLDMTGGNRVVSIYADRLKRRGHQVVAVSVAPGRPSFRGIVRSIVKERRWPATAGPQPSHFDSLDVEVRRLAHAGPVTDGDVPDADVVIATWWETAEWVTALAPAKGAKVHFVQDHEVWAGQRDRVDAVYRLPLARIVISGWLRDMLRKEYQQEAIALIGNSVDTVRFDAPPRGKQAVPTVGLVYVTKHNKGTDIALKAFALAAERVPGLRLAAMGNERVADTLPLPPGSDFTFQARDNAARDLYARCDAWLFPTRWEGYGLPILEAMACRTPVIGAPAGAAPELIAKGGGILVAPEDPQAMADAIVRVCTMPDAEWRALSEAARATATGFTWDDATTQFEETLRKVATG